MLHLVLVHRPAAANLSGSGLQVSWSIAVPFQHISVHCKQCACWLLVCCQASDDATKVHMLDSVCDGINGCPGHP
ncbi:hypothetical protein WJX77_005079 [Trebouxia sp. C0004]